MPVSTMFTPGHTPIDGVVRKLAVSADGTIVIPKNAAIKFIHVRNNTANAITGGLKIGTTASGTDVLAAGVIPASSLASFVPIIAAIGQGVVRTLYVEDVTAWNGASIDVAIEYTVLA